MRKHRIDSLILSAFVLVACVGSVAPARAQDGASPIRIDLGGDAGGPKFTPPDFVWATSDVDARRWLEDPATSAGPIAKDTRLEVLDRDGGFVRVRFSGTKFGWIAESSTTKEKPATAAGGDASGLPTLQPPKLLGGPGTP
ncbi:hypothetical protein L6R50_01650 [Myxococcota bacterium]|nr:hypothetical protein [Myxococcota bacterium]